MEDWCELSIERKEGMIDINKDELKEITSEYEGLSDFLLHAFSDEKKKVITEAARRANEDQFKVFSKAQLKVGAN